MHNTSLISSFVNGTNCGARTSKSKTLSAAALAASTQAGGYLLRTKIRAAIEFLDQLYQYGKAGNTTINELGEETFEEDVPIIDDF